ncbi:MFS transporter [Nocardia vaccinii]|uniref:MFS transporter n=1 Tax=Nocardia vaccinii TaxID=1822 RepID=UPI00082A8204|nr:MFS transporter [Nocardia vaccinii]
MISLPEKYKLLRNAGYSRFLAARGLSQFGTELSLVSVAFAVLDVAHTPGALGSVLAARTIPNIVFLIVGGVVADRYPRGRILVGSDIAAFLVQSTLAWWILCHGGHLLVTGALQLLLGTTTAAFRPAAAGFTKSVVPEQDLQRANALIGSVENFSCLAGPAIAGGIVLALGPGWAVAMDAATYLASALLLMPLWRNVERPQPTAAGDRPGLRTELMQGWHALRSRRWIGAYVLEGLCFQAGFAVFFTLGPLLLAHSGTGAGGWGVLVTAFGAGSLAGSIFSLHVQPARPLSTGQFGFAVTIPAMVLLGITDSLFVLVPLTFLAAAGFATTDTFFGTTLQRKVPDSELGRVSAFAMIGSSALRPFGYLIAGGAAAALGTSVTLFSVAAVLFFAILSATLAVPELGAVEQFEPGQDNDSSAEMAKGAEGAS